VPRCGLLVLETDVGDDDSSRVEASGSDRQPDLGAMERHGEIRGDDGACDLPRRRVDSGR
jgi:hypothetical protein